MAAVSSGKEYFCSISENDMKILHTADWHLGNTFHSHSRLQEHEHFLSWLVGTLSEEEPDVVLLAGDIFDSPNPSASAENLFYKFLHDATDAVPGLQIVVCAGNHDSGGRLEAPEALLYTHNIYVRGTLRRNENDNPDYAAHIIPVSLRSDPEAKAVVFAMPYLRSGDYALGLTQEEGIREAFKQMERELKRSDFGGLPVVVCAHFYAAGAEVVESEHSERLVVGGQDCVDADKVCPKAAFLALGHIHKAQQVGARSWYSGSALPMSFSEKKYVHGVNIVSLDADGEASVVRKTYKPLRPLVSIPEKGAASVEQLLNDIEALPNRKKDDEGADWPYVELRVRESRPEPGLLHAVTEALSEKAVRFCRMTREVAEASKRDKAETDNKQVTQLEPADLAQRVFESRYHEPMPKDMLSRLQEAIDATE